MAKISFGIIGTNFISDKFVQAASSVDDVDVRAIYSRTKERGDYFAQKHGIEKSFDDIEAFLRDESINSVYVASPTFLHKEHTIKTLAYGKHVLCEKSLAIEYSEFLEMKNAAEKSGLVFLEAMRPAHDPAISTLISSVDKIGKIRRAHFEFCKYSSRYDKFKMGIIENAFDPEMKNSALHDIGIYPLWLAVKMFGEPHSVYSSSIKLSNGFDGAGEIILNYQAAVVSVSYSKITEGVSSSYIEGEDGTLLIDKISEPSLITLRLRDGTSQTLFSSSCNNNMIYEIASFRDMILGSIDCAPFLNVSESLMRTLDRVIFAQKSE